MLMVWLCLVLMFFLHQKIPEIMHNSNVNYSVIDFTLQGMLEPRSSPRFKLNNISLLYWRGQTCIVCTSVYSRWSIDGLQLFLCASIDLIIARSFLGHNQSTIFRSYQLLLLLSSFEVRLFSLGDAYCVNFICSKTYKK